MEPTADADFLKFLPGNKQDDSSCIARFYLQPVLHAAKSREAKREVYEDHEFVEIMVKGQPQQVYTGKIRQRDVERFPNAYAAFKANQPAPVIGTPIEQLPGMGPSQALFMKAMGIRTMEDMANLDDMGLQKVGMGAREIQKQCKAFLANSTEKNVALEEENKALKERMATLEAQMASLMQPGSGGSLGAAVKTPQKGRGRKEADEQLNTTSLTATLPGSVQ